MIRSVPLPDARVFAHDAMNTTFSVRIIGGSETDARGMAGECFERLDQLEGRLSRFIDGSDVSRINRMRAGETLYLSESCHECLLLALDAHARTAGLFDISQGARIEHRKSGAGGPPPPLAGRLTIHPDTPAVTCDEPGREIDLGGIGKGFALDQLALLLPEWGAEGALLAAGASTLLAVGPQPWPVELAGDAGSRRIVLCGRALSASGTGVQGSHIIDPRGDGGGADGVPRRLWVVAASAALADAFSTAAMLMSPDELGRFLAIEEAIDAAYADTGAEVTGIPAAG